MNTITLDISSNPILKLTYVEGSNAYLKFSKNNATDKFVGQLEDGKIVSNLLCDIRSEMTYTSMNFGMIGMVTIEDNNVLFAELEKLL